MPHTARTRHLSVLVTVLLAVVLTACGSGPEPSGAEQAPTSGDSFPVTIPHTFGETTIESSPERIVTLGVTDADAVLALGTTPVAVTGYTFYPETGLGPWTEPYVEGTQPVRLDSDSDPNLEQIVALEPDLIIGVTAGFDKAIYDLLSQIAPTIARPAGTAAYTVPRDDATRMIATALGRPEQGEELISSANDAFARAASANPEFQGKRGVVVLPYDGKYGAYFPGDSRGQFMTQLGFRLPDEIAALDTGDTYFTEISRERLGMLDGDVLVMLADDPAARAFIDSDPALAAVPVVQEGRMIVPDTDTRGAMTYNSVLSVPYALDHLVPALQTALR